MGHWIRHVYLSFVQKRVEKRWHGYEGRMYFFRMEYVPQCSEPLVSKIPPNSALIEGSVQLEIGESDWILLSSSWPTGLKPPWTFQNRQFHDGVKMLSTSVSHDDGTYPGLMKVGVGEA